MARFTGIRIREALLMAKSKTIEIAGAGHVLFERSKKAKHLNISVRPYKGVRVAVPYGITFKKAGEIVKSKIDWIQKHQARMAKIEKEQNDILDRIAQIDRKTAKEKLINRLNELAVKHNFKYNKVFIRNQKTRLGSCSSKNNINLNIKLILLPDDLMDYVILHELVHTKIKSHGKEFYMELGRFVGDARELRKRLKRCSLGMV